MCKLSMRAILLSSILLLLRTTVPEVHGQLNRPEWNVRVDADSPLREPPVEKAVNPANTAKTSEEGVDWADSVQGAPFSRELVSGSSNNGLEHQPLGNAVKYILPKNQNYPQRIISERIGLNRPFQLQRSNMRESDFPAMDYTYDDIAQQLQPGYYPFSIPSLSSSVRARVKPRETAGLPRYLFSNFKRARDGYLCHFKLCQVGVSGKRLSSM